MRLSPTGEFVNYNRLSLDISMVLEGMVYELASGSKSRQPRCDGELGLIFQGSLSTRSRPRTKTLHVS
jgi:hypothetical protein